MNNCERYIVDFLHDGGHKGRIPCWVSAQRPLGDTEGQDEGEMFWDPAICTEVSHQDGDTEIVRGTSERD